MKNLVIVESPAKAKTIEKFLGKNFKVKASVGHVRDLPKSKIGIDVENNFEPKYIQIKGKAKVINELKKAVKESEKVYLATDPDREGEAISWHLAHLLSLDEKDNNRIEFSEITKEAIKSAIQKPRTIDMNLVNAQQARRILDRLVGYNLSPLLWKKVKKGLSAGRVQSIALKIVCEREKEIVEFVPQKYFTLDIEFKDSQNLTFTASYNGTDEEISLKIDDEKQLKKILCDLQENDYTVDSVSNLKKSRKPPLPFKTSTLQQTASTKIKFSPKKTMSVAQQLYEGIDLAGIGRTGLITYMRTDSTRIAKEAVNNTLSFIKNKHGEDYVGVYKPAGKKASSQDAHECIRPVNIEYEPLKIKDDLTPDQYKLYKLIYERYICSLSTDYKYNQTTIKIKNGEYIFKIGGTQSLFMGYYYLLSSEKPKETNVPILKKNDKVNVTDVINTEQFTQPPSRFSEASLIKDLESKGIGRPSTYSPTLSTLYSRGYTEKEGQSIKPTELGILVDDIISNNFGNIVNEKFTENLEKKLDNVEEGKVNWKDVVSKFYVTFEKELNEASEKIGKISLEKEIDEKCELCNKQLVIRPGRYGEFISCSNFPECKYTRSIEQSTGIKCPSCKEGDLIKKKTRQGKDFWGCSKYPECDFATWFKPIEELCKICGYNMGESTFRGKTTVKCTNKNCK